MAHISSNAVTSNLWQIAAVTGGYFIFNITDAFVKYLTQHYDLFQVIVMAAYIGGPIIMAIALYKHGWALFHTSKPGWHLLRALSAVIVTFLVVFSLKLIPLATFYSIVFTSPLIASLLSGLLLKEHIGLGRFIAIIFGFCGVLVITKLEFSTMNIGTLAALGAATAHALGTLTLRKLGSTEKIMQFALFPLILNALVFTPFALPHLVVPDASHMPLFLMYGILIACGIMLISWGMSHATATSIVAPFHYTQMIWGVMIGYVFFAEVPEWNVLIGSAMIIGGSIYIVMQQRRASLFQTKTT